ncbi:unnamed protein product, partial [Symbiodinium microadriaticum]
VMTLSKSLDLISLDGSVPLLLRWNALEALQHFFPRPGSRAPVAPATGGTEESLKDATQDVALLLLVIILWLLDFDVDFGLGRHLYSTQLEIGVLRGHQQQNPKTFFPCPEAARSLLRKHCRLLAAVLEAMWGRVSESLFRRDMLGPTFGHTAASITGLLLIEKLAMEWLFPPWIPTIEDFEARVGKSTAVGIMAVANSTITFWGIGLLFALPPLLGWRRWKIQQLPSSSVTVLLLFLPALMAQSAVGATLGAAALLGGCAFLAPSTPHAASAPAQLRGATKGASSTAGATAPLAGAALLATAAALARPAESATTRRAAVKKKGVKVVHGKEIPWNLFTPKAPYPGKVIENDVHPQTLTEETGDANWETCHVTFDHDGKVPYIEGQSIGVIAPGPDKKGETPARIRLYSIASSAVGDNQNSKTVSLCVKRVVEVDGKFANREKGEDKPDKAGTAYPENQVYRGVCSNHICDMSPGDDVMITGPTGAEMLLPEDPEANIIMLATGTGIAPMRSYCRLLFHDDAGASGDGRKFKGKAWLFMGVPYSKSLLYDDEHQDYKKNYPDQFRYDYAVSREQKNAAGQKMYIQTKMAEYADELWDLMQDEKTHVYMCGLKGMESGMAECFGPIAEKAGKDWAEFAKAMKKADRYHVEAPLQDHRILRYPSAEGFAKVSMQDRSLDMKMLKRSLPLIAFNFVLQVVVGVPFLIYLLPASSLDWHALPSTETLARDITVWLLVEEVCFFYVHRWLHQDKRMYAAVHKLHHTWTAPISIVAIYCHPFEHLVSNIIPVLLGPLICRSHAASFGVFLSVGTVHTLAVHSGYWFCDDNGMHDEHHAKFNVNFGVTGMMDKWYGTYQPYIGWEVLKDVP